MSRRTLLLFTVILLLATAARLHGIQTQSLWFDEGWSAYAAGQPTLVDAANADATNPPLYYVLLNVSARFLGETEFSLRLFSLFCGLLVIALTYRFARELFGGRGAIYAALLAACSPLLWWASQEARMYTLLAALVLVCALAWHRLYARPTRWWAWLALWSAELALLYAHNTAPVVVVWLNVVTVIAWVVKRRADTTLNWKVWISGQALVALLWMPYFFTRFVNLAEANRAVVSPPELSTEFALHLWQSFWQTPWERVLLSGESALPYLAILAAFVLLTRWRLAASRWLILHVLVLITGLVAALMVLGNEMHGRYLVMVVPLLLVPFAAGIAHLRPRLPRLGIAGLLVLLFLCNMRVAQTSDYRHDDARAMVQYYAETLDTDDTVLAWSYADRYELAYYWDRLGVRARRVTLPEGADLDAVLPLLPDSGDVGLNVWYTQRADYRGMLPCILGSGTVNEPVQHTVHGMSNLLYQGPALSLPQLTEVDLVFSDEVTAIAWVIAHGQIQPVTADQAQCLPIQIELLRDGDMDLKAALIVQNELGWEIARADAVFATPDQRTSAALPTGATLTAYPLLRLPYGAPEGEYRVFLRVYDETVQPSGYLPPAGVTISGRDGMIGVWQAPSGAAWEQVDRNDELSNRVDIPLGDNLTLIAHNASMEGAVTNGGDIRLTLLWQGAGEMPVLMLADEAAQWNVEVPTHIEAHGTITRDWRSVRVPAGAPSGVAELRLLDGTVIGSYTIESLPMLTEPPEYDQSVGIEFPGVGELVGYTLNEPVTADQAPVLNLVWRGGGTASEVSYTVFAQLVNTDGQVVAQSDSIPASHTRPTTGWRDDEYIEDRHTLSYNDLNRRGETMLIVGLYNAANNQRLQLTDGTDHVVLESGIVLR
jgi:uncharacterized membrane protein